MKAIIHGRIVLPDAVVSGKALLFDEKIHAIVSENEVPAGAEIIDAEGRYVCPGLIDVHIHGFLGEDASITDLAGIRKISEGIAQHGVTAYLPTTMTVSYDTLENAFDVIREAKKLSEADGWQGAQILGVNSEGPFINAKKKGAQAEEHVHAPDAAFIQKHADIIRLCTLAPDVDGALDFIKIVRETTDVRISMGHTAASYDQAVAGADAGATHVTHLFNAMSPLSHREPGMPGAALARKDLYAEMICDTFHVHPAMYGPVLAAKGDHLVLITDCLSAGGLPDGKYLLGGADVIRKGIECRLPDGTIAGSVLTLNKGVYNLMKHTGADLPRAMRLGSLSPAKAIGADSVKGSIELGKDADIWLADEELNACSVYLRGRKIK